MPGAGATERQVPVCRPVAGTAAAASAAHRPEPGGRSGSDRDNGAGAAGGRCRGGRSGGGRCGRGRAGGWDSRQQLSHGAAARGTWQQVQPPATAAAPAGLVMASKPRTRGICQYVEMTVERMSASSKRGGHALGRSRPLPPSGVADSSRVETLRATPAGPRGRLGVADLRRT